MKKNKNNEQHQISEREKEELKFALYEAAVQNPEFSIKLIKQQYKKYFSRPLRFLREDFCGTAFVSSEFVKDDPAHHALAIDQCKKTLEIGQRRHLNKLTEQQKKHISLCLGDVRSSFPFKDFSDEQKAEVILAENFSYNIFKEDFELQQYFEATWLNLAEEGLFIFDVLGGGANYVGVQKNFRTLKDVQVTPTNQKVQTYKNCAIYWRQNNFNPENNFSNFSMNLGSQNMFFKDAFCYDWRLRSIPELNKMLLLCGFSSISVLWEAQGHKQGLFREQQLKCVNAHWIAYIVAKK